MSPLLAALVGSWVGSEALPAALRVAKVRPGPRFPRDAQYVAGGLLGALVGYRAATGRCCVWNAIKALPAGPR